MNPLATVSNTLITAILDGVAPSPAEQLDLISGAGLDAEKVRDVNARTSIVALWRLWDAVLKRTGDEFVGLTIGRTIPAERFGLAVHAAQHGETFRHVVQRFARFAGLINAMIKCTLEETEDVARFIMKFHWDVFDLERHATDIVFAGFLGWARENVDSAFKLREVRFKHSREAARSRYELCFGAPVVFAAPRNELVFAARELDRSVSKSNPELGAMLGRYAELELAATPVVTSLPDRVVQLVRAELRAGRKVDLPRVAAQLKLAPRLLQKKLSESSTSFTQLLDDERRALAPSLLALPQANVEQVGYQLGYAEPTAFIRAFRKWYGVTPGKYRVGV